MSKMNKIEKKQDFIETLTPKEAIFLNHWLETGNGLESALKAYDCKNRQTAGVIAHDVLKKLKHPMRLYLENKGLGVNSLYKVLDGALNAEKTDITGDKHPDHKVRLEAGDRLARWLEVDTQPQELNQTNIQLVFTRGEENGT